ncbi:hypothetical protein [Streptomyces sp. NPDC058755]|uniref:hypothetical protein n=1 Tax=Streptomyces sp. NPDC058755 TaxID=3346624 RepID=UPI00367A6798
MSDRFSHDRGPCDAATDTTSPESAGPAAARRPVRMCVRCHSVTDTPTVVYEVHQSSGSGFNVYACEACAPFFPPPADVLTVLPDSRRTGGDR